MEPDTRELLAAMEARLERMEARQKKQQRRFLLVLAVAVLAAALLFAAVVPALRRSSALLDALEPVSTALAQTDPEQIAALLENFAAMDLSALEGLDTAALQKITDMLQETDIDTLNASLAALQKIDIERLNGALEQMEATLTDLNGLDVEAINDALANMNKVLEPLTKFFG